MLYNDGSSTLEAGAVTSTVSYHRNSCLESSSDTDPFSVVVAYQTVFGAIRHGKETTGESSGGAIKTKD